MPRQAVGSGAGGIKEGDRSTRTPGTPHRRVDHGASHVHRPAGGLLIRPGDRVRGITGQMIHTIGDFQRAIETLREGDWLAVLVQRGQLASYIAVAVGTR